MNMDQNYIDSNNVVERYVLGHLSNEEQDAFEIHLLESKDAREDVETVEQLGHGLQQNATTSSSASDSRVSQLRRPFLLPALAAAASAVFSVGLTLLVMDRPEPVPSGYSTTSVFELVQLRSAESNIDAPTFRPGDSDQWITLLAYPSFDGFDEYRAVIEHFEREDVWNPIFSSRIEPGSSESLMVSVQRSQLRSGLHRLQVEGLRGEQSFAVLTIPFRVESP